MGIKKNDGWVVDDSHLKNKGFSHLTLQQRKDIEKYLKAGWRVKDICMKVKCSRGTLYYERMRFNGESNQYDAEVAHKQATSYAKRTEIPLTYQRNISNIYRITLELKNLSGNSQKHMQLINMIIYYLELCGADGHKIKKPLTAHEKARAVELFQQGKTYNAIAVEMNRCRSTIHCYLSKLENLEKVDPLEIENKALDKWREFCENNEDQ